MATFVR